MAAPDTRTCSPPSPSGANPGDIAQGITYDAVASGGDTPYTYVWTVDGPSAACGDAASCNVNFNATDYCARTNLMVTIQDTSICPDADSEPETVTKQTDITGTNQP